MDINSVCLNCLGHKGGFEVCPHCGHVAGTQTGDAWLLSPGTVLAGRYLIGTTLGSGGFGITYRAWDATLDMPVAVKEFYPAGLVSRIPGEAQVRLFSGDKQQVFAQHLARFMDEGRNLALFSGQRHVVNVFDFFEANGTAYIIMEYLDGLNLKEYMAGRGGRLPADEALAMAGGILEGLASIHKKGIIHRDISPDNIFILKDGSVKVLDFGAARLGSAQDSALTQAVVIKMGYAPPEQYRTNMRQGVWTDIYAVGATLYKMLTGVTPEESVDRMEKDTLRRPNQLGAGVPPGVEKAIMKSMALKPELRFASAGEMLAALQSRTVVDYPEEELKKRKRTRGILMGAAGAAVVALAAVIGWQMAKPTQDTLASLDIAPDSITVAAPVWDEEAAEAYRQVVDAFIRQYPEHQVTLETYNHDDYALQVENGLGKAGGPTVVQSSWLEGAALAGTADLQLLVDSLDRGSLWHMDDWETCYPGKNQLPTGLNVMVAFVDELAFAEAGLDIPDRIDSASQLADLARQGCKAAILGEDTGFFLNTLYPGLYDGKRFSATAQVEAGLAAMGDAFASGAIIGYEGTGEVPVEVGWFVNIRTVQHNWAGHYQVLPVQGSGGMAGCFNDEWSINAAATDNQQKVGMLFLHFLLSEYAQNALHIQQDGSVPLNRTAFGQYTETNPEFDFINRRSMGRVQVYAQDYWEMVAFSGELYAEVLAPDGPRTDAGTFIKNYS